MPTKTGQSIKVCLLGCRQILPKPARPPSEGFRGGTQTKKKLFKNGLDFTEVSTVCF